MMNIIKGFLIYLVGIVFYGVLNNIINSMSVVGTTLLLLNAFKLVYLIGLIASVGIFAHKDLKNL